MAPVDTAATIDRRATDPKTLDPKTETKPTHSGAVKIDLKKIDRKPTPKTQRYWVGVMPDAPFDQTSVAGIAYVRYSERTPIDESGKLNERIPHARGTIAEMTDDQVEVVRKRAGNVVLRVIRSNGETGGASGKGARIQRLYLDDPRGYRPMPGDSPLGHWLYMMPVSEKMSVGWRDATPERMCDDATFTT